MRILDFFHIPDISTLSTEARITFRNECQRALAAGVIETAESTFLLLIAVRYFHAAALQKSLIASAGSFGLFLAPLAVYVVSLIQRRAAQSLSSICYAAALSFFIAALLPWQWVFVLASVIAISLKNCSIPLLTHIYQNNYPESLRGKLFSASNSARILSAGFFSAAAGYLISGRIEQYQWLLLFFAVAFVASAVLFRRCPSTRLAARGSRDFFRGFRYIRSDPTFRLTLFCWMFMGIGNLMMVPLRVEYLASERYGLMLSEADIALFVSIIPICTRFFLSPIWGRLFDYMNFFTLRIVVNLSFMMGILTFFFADSFAGLTLGSLCYGIAGAGGDVAWSLWVTKFAPEERVSDYMAVHTFFTGFRGIIAPMLSFQLITVFAITDVAWLSAALILAASLFLVPEAVSRSKNA